MLLYFFFFFNDTATTEIYTLSLHDALPIFSDADNQWTDQEIRRADVVRRSVAAGKPPGPHRPRGTQRRRENDALPPHSAQRVAGRWRNHLRAKRDGWLPPAGNRTRRRRDRARIGY